MTSQISPALKSSARSAYRALFRSSGATFAGDDRVLYAFRDKVRTETIAGRQELDPAEYEARVQHAFEVAAVLKKNFVQGTKEGDIVRLRITPDTELGSNEGVKAPYSRPARGEPRLKCGEDPNAVAPLPPKSLRASLGTGAGSTRPYSTKASASESEPQPGIESEHNKARVQSLVDKLSQVNRRVSASMTGKGKEVVVERVLLEDKIGALAARIEYLAQTHTPPEGLQSAMDALLDIIWLNPDDVKTAGKRSDPPAQMRHFVRYLHKAGREAAESREAAMRLSPELRIAIGEEMETPAPGTKIPGAHTPADDLRDIIWRMLMVKRGMQRVVTAGDGVNFGALVGTVRRTLSHLTYAQDCLEDLEKHGPRNEDIEGVVEELERVVGGSTSSPMFDMMRAVQARLEQGTVWSLIEKERDRSKSMRMGDDGVEYNSRPRYRQPYHYLRFFEEEEAVPPPIGSIEHTLWRREQLTRAHKVVARVRRKIESITTTLDGLTALFSERNQHPDKAAPLQTAKDTLAPAILAHDQEAELFLRSLALQEGKVVEWAKSLGSIRGQTKVVERQLRAIDPVIRAFFRAQPVEELLVNKAAQALFVNLWMEIMLAFDCIWRVNRRLKLDKSAMLSLAKDQRTRTSRPGLEPTIGNLTKGSATALKESEGHKDKLSGRTAPTVLRASWFADRSNGRKSSGVASLRHVLDALVNAEKTSQVQLRESRK